MKSREFEHHGWIKQLIEQVKTPDFLVLLVSGTLMSLTFCVIGPLELYFSNANEFWFDIVDLVIYIVAFFLLTLAICIVTGLLVKRRRFVCISLFFGTGLALYLQANFLNGNMGLLNGTEVDWCASWGKVILNSGIWIACIAVPILLYHFAKKSWHEMLVVISIIVIGMQTAAVIFLAISVSTDDKEVQLTTDDIFTLSANENMIVFVLDTMDAKYFEDYVMNEEQSREVFKDFIYFNNTISGGAPTTYGLPILLTGSYYNGEPYSEYISNAYEKADLYYKLQKNNYDVRIYTENQFVSNKASEYLDNTYESKKIEVESPVALLKKLYQLVGYKYFPRILKNDFFIYSGEFEQFKSSEDFAPYVINDAAFIQKYREKGLTLFKNKNVFKLYHLHGAHPPYTLNEFGHSSDSETTVFRQIQGVFSMLYEYIDEMKRLGVYDKSTILIVADHGGIELYQNPMLLIKKKNMTKESLTITHAPVTFQNVLPTLSFEIDGENGENNKTLFEVNEDEKVVRQHVITPHLANQYFQSNQYKKPLLFCTEGLAKEIDSFILLKEVEMNRENILYELGDTLLLSGKGADTLYEGFTFQGEEAIWMEESEARQQFQFLHQPQKNLEVNIQLDSIFHAPQQITIYFNNFLVYSQLQSENLISFVVPKEAINEGAQEIVYYASTARPEDVIGTSDTRCLSIKLYAMEMHETDASAQVVNCINAYSIGQKISFVDHEGKKYFMSGLSTVQGTDYSWSLGQTGKIVLDVGSFQGDLIGEFGLKYVYDSSQRLVIRHNEQILYDEVVMSASGPIRFLVPSDCIEEGKLILDLEYPDAVSPKSQGVSEDARKLALAFTSMQFSAEIPVYQIGEELNFSENGVGINTLFGGFSLQEKMGIWSCKTEACQKFQFAELPEKNL